MKLARIVMFFNICLLGIMPVMSFAKPFVVLGADTEDVLDDVEVLDQATGLIWKHCPHGQFWNGADCGNSSFVVTHEEALDLALNLGSTSDLEIGEVSALHLRTTTSCVGEIAHGPG